MRSSRTAPESDANQVRSVIETGKKVLRIESDSVAGLIDRIDHNFAQVVFQLNTCKGHVVVTGMGKSGLIGSKIAATFSSIGLPAVFLHAAEASHGDIGIITKNDLIIAISNSGETEEILKLLPILKRLKCTLAAMTGNPNSTLAKRCDFTLDIGVKEEACSRDLVPTSSTTATLAMGDALAMALLELRGFREEDFAQNHPGGSLGKKLLTTVEDLMRTEQEIPLVTEEANISDVLREMSEKCLGTTLVVDENRQIAGIITDGDLRRLIEKKVDISSAVAGQIMSSRPKTILPDCMAAQAVQQMEEFSITSLAVTEDGKNILGIIHLQDLLRAGIV
jgi:arabinose-5-phosphate isomerase